MMSKIVENNWADVVEPNNNIKVLKSHPDTPIDWVIYPNNGFGIGVRVAESCQELEESNREFINSEVIDLGVGYKYLTFYCCESALKPIFNQLCLDVISFCIEHVEIKDLGPAIIERSNAWERLFSKGITGLGKKAAKGLFAELDFLENHWLKKGLSIENWTGPNGDEVDFRAESFSIEVKVRSTNNTIKVASLEQLQLENNTTLYTLEITEDENGISLDEYVESLSSSLEPEQQRVFIDKVLSTGFIKNKNYNKKLITNSTEFYSIALGFPRIEPGQIKGIIAAKYDVDLSAATNCIITEEEFDEKFGR